LSSVLTPMKEVKLLFRGLDASGKTSLLYKLKLGEVITTIPTMGFNVETLVYENVRMIAWEGGGGDRMVPLIETYHEGTHGLIFVVDSHDRERIPEARYWLHRCLKDDKLREAAFLVLANKADMEGALGGAQLFESLELEGFTHRKLCVLETSARTGEGLREAMAWLARMVGE